MTRKAIQEAFERLRDGEEMQPLEAAARSRSEADWIVGMNATRAASIRLRAAFDGAVSLGRVQTPTLALVARREEEIRNFKPEPYWLVEAKFEATGERRYDGRYLGGKRIAEDLAAEIVEACRGKQGEITKLEKKEERERSQLLYDLTSLQRHANTLLRLLRPAHARRGAEALRAAQGDHLPAHELALAVGRPRRGDPADRRARREEPAVREGRGLRHVAEGAAARPRRQRQEGHRPPRDHPDALRAQPRRRWARTSGRSTTSSRSASSRSSIPRRSTSARASRPPSRSTSSARAAAACSRRAGSPSTARRSPTAQPADDDSGGDQTLPKLEQGETVDTLSVESLRKETQPPRRYTEASLLAAMETAGKDIEDAELREAMKESGIGTPATRAAIIERLLSVGYIERDGRALHATEKGVQVIRLLGEHPLTSPQLTGEWEKRLELIADGEESRPSFMNDIAKFTESTVQELDKLKGVKIERANLGPCPVCGKDVIENRKGYSCWSKDDPGCGFVIWKKKAGKNLPASVVKELMASLKASIERGDDPPVGRTEKQVTGFRGRSGRSFRAKLQRRAVDARRRQPRLARRVRRGVGQPARADPAVRGGRRRRRQAAKEKVAEAEALGAGGDARRRGQARARARLADRQRHLALRHVLEHADEPRRAVVVHDHHAARPVGALARAAARELRRPRPAPQFMSRAPVGARQSPSSGSGPLRWVWP